MHLPLKLANAVRGTHSTFLKVEQGVSVSIGTHKISHIQYNEVNVA